MKRELKLRIASIEDTERRILALGGKLIKQDVQNYTYFNQPEGQVLKLTKKQEGVFKTVFRARDGKFDMISSDPIDNQQKAMDELAAAYGVKRSLVNHRKVFKLDEEELSLNDIEGVGCFLIIVSDNPTLDTATRLRIEDPEVITNSFDNL